MFDQLRKNRLAQHLKRSQVAKEARLIDRHRLSDSAPQMFRPVHLQDVDEVLKIRRTCQLRNRRQPRIEERIPRWIDQVRRLLQHQRPQIRVVRISTSHASPPAAGLAWLPHEAQPPPSSCGRPLPFAPTHPPAPAEATSHWRCPPPTPAPAFPTPQTSPHPGPTPLRLSHGSRARLPTHLRPFQSSSKQAFQRHTSAQPNGIGSQPTACNGSAEPADAGELCPFAHCPCRPRREPSPAGPPPCGHLREPARSSPAESPRRHTPLPRAARSIYPASPPALP